MGCGDEGVVGQDRFFFACHFPVFFGFCYLFHQLFLTRDSITMPHPHITMPHPHIITPIYRTHPTDVESILFIALHPTGRAFSGFIPPIFTLFLWVGQTQACSVVLCSARHPPTDTNADVIPLIGETQFSLSCSAED